MEQKINGAEQPATNGAEGGLRKCHLVRHGEKLILTADEDATIAVLPEADVNGIVERAIADIAIGTASLYGGLDPENLAGCMQKGADFLTHIAGNLLMNAQEALATTAHHPVEEGNVTPE